eukprot:s1712_g7.t1
MSMAFHSLWRTRGTVYFVQKYRFHVVDACEFGSEHKKSTAFLANFEAPRLTVRCSGQHVHKPWAIHKFDAGEWQFDTAKEAEYLVKLSKAAAASFIEHLLDSGDLPISGQFEAQGIEQLRQTAIWAQKAVVASCGKHVEDLEAAQSVRDETIEQASEDKQWVKGPLQFSKLQINKGRTGFLQSVSVLDREGIVNIWATARFFLGAARDGDRWRMPTEENVASGAISRSWPDGACLDLFGRCLNLMQAYKQLARHPSDSWAAVLAVLNPADRQVYFFEAVALPFGSVSSVLAFNRAARALRTILSKLFKLVVTDFFDDFCQMELGLLNDSACKTAELVMDLLDWKISTGDDKRKPFAKTLRLWGPHPGGILLDVEEKRKKQVIAQAEIFPVLVAKDTWKELLENRSVLWFLDNESARMALIRNISPILDNFCLLQLNPKLDVNIQARHWYNRAPSKSNPSDAASRLEFDSYSFAVKCEPIYNLAFKSSRSFKELLELVERG